MGRRYEVVSFLSDYGSDDEFVGVVHSVLRTIAPHLSIVDITHGIPAFDVRAGGLTLARSAQYLCNGLVLAVVDPGVATERRAVAVEVGNGDSVLVGPDNGLLAPAVALVGGANRAVSLTDTGYHLPAPGPTFAGRDILAPVVGYLANGVDLTDLGEEVEVASLIPSVMPVAVVEPGGIQAEVLWCDGYGNVQLNVDPTELDQLVGDSALVEIRNGERVYSARRVKAFEEVSPGGLGLSVDSYGLMAIVSARASAADALNIGSGDALVLAVPENESDNKTRVEITRRQDSVAKCEEM